MQKSYGLSFSVMGKIFSCLSTTKRELLSGVGEGGKLAPSPNFPVGNNLSGAGWLAHKNSIKDME